MRPGDKPWHLSGKWSAWLDPTILPSWFSASSSRKSPRAAILKIPTAFPAAFITLCHALQLLSDLYNLSPGPECQLRAGVFALFAAVSPVSVGVLQMHIKLSDGQLGMGITCPQCLSCQQQTPHLSTSAPSWTQPKIWQMNAWPLSLTQRIRPEDPKSEKRE